MEQQLEALTLQLESMKADNVEAASHNSTLEKAIAFKDFEVAKLQESNHVSLGRTGSIRFWLSIWNSAKVSYPTMSADTTHTSFIVPEEPS